MVLDIAELASGEIASRGFVTLIKEDVGKQPAKKGIR